MRLAWRLRVLTFLLAAAAPNAVGAQLRAPMPVPAPGLATDSASVVLVMRAVNERLASWAAVASVSDSAKAWVIQTPSGGGPVWDRARGWLAATLRARAPQSERESPQHFIKITSAVVRGDSLVASFSLGSTYPDRGISPSTVYRVRAKWGQFGWGAPVVEATLYVD